MYNAVIKSFLIVLNNPILMMSFVIYLIFLNLALPKMLVAQNLLVAALILSALLLFSAAFFAGWFQMIKTAISNSKIENKTDEEKIKELVEMKNDFFAAVPVYFLPLLGGIILYAIMLYALISLNFKFANHYFGSLDFITQGLSTGAIQTTESINAFIQSLPQDKILILFRWNMLFILTIGVFNFLIMFWLSALYYPSKCKANSLSALRDSIFAIFKHPIRSLGLYFFILILSYLFKLLGHLFTQNVVLYFLFMVLALYFGIFVFVLIFDYYEQRFYNHGDNWCDLIGKNKISD